LLRKPETKGIVRAETILGGAVYEADPVEPNTSHWHLINHSNPKGSIPYFMVKKSAPSIVPKLFESVRKGYEKNKIAIDEAVKKALGK